MNVFRMDLLSVISASTQDFKLILDYLPSYLPQFTGFHNIMMGISLGAHSAYRLASLLQPGQVSGFAIVVGCPTLGSLLLKRLRVDATSLGTSVPELGSVSYNELEAVMTEEQRRKWPRAIAKIVQDSDKKVYEEFPRDVPLMICNGKQDPLVPTFFTEKWLEKRQKKEPHQNVEFFVQDNTGHSCTKEMVALIADWIGNMFELKINSSSGCGLMPAESRL